MVLFFLFSPPTLVFFYCSNPRGGDFPERNHLYFVNDFVCQDDACPSAYILRRNRLLLLLRRH